MATRVPPTPPSAAPAPGARPAPAVVAERLAALRDAVASQRLEGLEPSAVVVAALERVARGESTIEDVIAGIHARTAADRRTRGEV